MTGRSVLPCLPDKNISNRMILGAKELYKGEKQFQNDVMMANVTAVHTARMAFTTSFGKWNLVFIS